jgi:NADH:ubiquinone oxidoreductase subunit E
VKEIDSSVLVDVLKECRTHPTNILRTLLTVQDALGYVPPEAVADIARSLEVTEADVAGVLSYYPELRTRAAGRHLVRICMGESCVANHCSRVLAALRGRLRIDLGETTSDNRFSLERVYCLGNCAVSPSVMVDDEIYGRVRGADVLSILEGYE